MTLSPWTNEVGYHLKYDFRADTMDVWSNAIRGDPPLITSEYTGSGAVLVGKSLKQEPAHGDHVTPLSYSRSNYLVTSDEPFTYHDKEVWDDDGSTRYESYRTAYLSRIHGGFYYDATDGLDNDHAIGEADTKALNDIAANKLNGGEDIGQRRQTVNQFVGAAERGAKFLLALKNLRLAELARLAGLSPSDLVKNRGRTQADLWLEYSYGWRPLAQDVYGLSELANEVLAKPLFVKGRGSATIKAVQNWENGEDHVNTDASTSVRTKLYASIENEGIRALNQAGLVNPLSIAWELVPWSFAIDWFVPVGATLDAITATCGLSFVNGYRSLHENSTARITRDVGRRSWRTECTAGGLYEEKAFHFYRQALADFPRPAFYGRDNPYSTSRALNALALVRQLLK